MLTGKQRRHLRALGHELKPIVHVGKGGIDEGLVAALDQALADHELVKIKLGDAAGVDRQDAAADLAKQTRSEVAQVLGYTVLLYRADPEDPKIELPVSKGQTGNTHDDDDDDDDAEETASNDKV